jgi:hypothetical protein
MRDRRMSAVRVLMMDIESRRFREHCRRLVCSASSDSSHPKF